MASDESINICNNNNNNNDNDNNYANEYSGTSYKAEEWIPLSLTTVEYPRGDWIGKFLALTSLLPFSIISGFVALILFRRDLHTISFFIGTMFNEATNLILKELIKESRPVSRAALYTEYGMPSSHSQFMWFFTIYIIYFIFIKCQHIGSSNKTMGLGMGNITNGGGSWLSYGVGGMDRIWRLGLTSVCVTAAALVGYSRVYLQYHTWNQVLAGIAVGAFNATIWFAVTYLVLTPLFPTIASWRLSEFLLLRDTTLIPNVLWFEYTNSRQEARARARKMVSIKTQ